MPLPITRNPNESDADFAYRTLFPDQLINTVTGLPITPVSAQATRDLNKDARDLKIKQNTLGSQEQQDFAKATILAANMAIAAGIKSSGKTWQDVLGSAQGAGSPITSGVDQQMVDDSPDVPLTVAQRSVINVEIKRLQALLK